MRKANVSFISGRIAVETCNRSPQVVYSMLSIYDIWTWTFGHLDIKIKNSEFFMNGLFFKKKCNNL